MTDVQTCDLPIYDVIALVGGVKSAPWYPAARTQSPVTTPVPVDSVGHGASTGTVVTYDVVALVGGVKSAHRYPAARTQSPETTPVPVDSVGHGASTGTVATHDVVALVGGLKSAQIGRTACRERG